jgi:hypothetical protein
VAAGNAGSAEGFASDDFVGKMKKNGKTLIVFFGSQTGTGLSSILIVYRHLSLAPKLRSTLDGLSRTRASMASMPWWLISRTMTWCGSYRRHV